MLTFFSSLPVGQSGQPSHSYEWGRHSPVLHCNSAKLQVPQLPSSLLSRQSGNPLHTLVTGTHLWPPSQLRFGDWHEPGLGPWFPGQFSSSLPLEQSATLLHLLKSATHCQRLHRNSNCEHCLSCA